MGGEPLEFPALKDNAPAPGRRQPGDGPERGGLAGAVGSQQRDDPASGDAKADPVQGLDGPIGDLKVEDFQHGMTSLRAISS